MNCISVDLTLLFLLSNDFRKTPSISNIEIPPPFVPTQIWLSTVSIIECTVLWVKLFGLPASWYICLINHLSLRWDNIFKPSSVPTQIFPVLSSNKPLIVSFVNSASLLLVENLLKSWLFSLKRFNPPPKVATQICSFLSIMIRLTTSELNELGNELSWWKFKDLCPSKRDSPSAEPNHIKPFLSWTIVRTNLYDIGFSMPKLLNNLTSLAKTVIQLDNKSSMNRIFFTFLVATYSDFLSTTFS